ncbi:MAG: DUF3618 domain-containing protein [Mobiluncus porci]|uniref:DUF3618 domain-containing protein n=1 Tax=Mobiluncus porci TaxID=2652278 RepID=A0A7K0K1G9_9ACTO|nr:MULTISPECIES: DUF3618 domain-containing protein [Mobiluncus]MCI6584994.1 DUF3618 domain-containing protein [Mobiluncus sp.]MDD7542134.1 DUF3618 domain-containing protein [Mobiluncus porci]MDY5748993.1 DUF3618 domain-containing protein [Mobiluncus porci]MST48875.1 DUF3618 domain-containing protein [Mobiluncus porci]
MSDPQPNPVPEVEDFGENPSDIEDKIRRAREEMSETVDELVDRMRPANQAKAAKEKAMGMADAAKQTFDDALAGDAESQKKLGIAAGAIAGFILLATLKHRKK